MGDLSNLEILGLFGNQLTGEILPELGRLTNLESLYLDDNQLTGEIPPELGRLTNLLQLGLDDNQLTGEIPPELGRLINLEDLTIGGNRLTGCIPAVWRDVPINDLDALGLDFCEPTSPGSTPSGSVSATRSFSPASVAPGGQVTVTITAANYGALGAVTETLPQGFSYLSSGLPDDQVTEARRSEYQVHPARADLLHLHP